MLAVLPAKSGLIVNGSFETGDLFGWTIAPDPPGDAAIVWGLPRASQGSFGLDFDAYSAPATAVLQQGFVTTPGVAYTLSFDFGVVALNNRTGSLNYRVIGQSSDLISDSIGLSSSSGESPVQWTSVSRTFIADGSNAVVWFQDTTPDGNACDPVLDNVQVDAIVPEPETFAMLALGAGVIGLVSWRKRH
jgi:hypothetical protein